MLCATEQSPWLMLAGCFFLSFFSFFKRNKKALLFLMFPHQKFNSSFARRGAQAIAMMKN